jgi:hypothetical protein
MRSNLIPMKKSLLAVFVTVALFATSAVFADSNGKEVTLTGTGKCAKCSLAMTDKCQNALVVKNDGKEETYLLVKNDVSEKFHKNICEEDKEIKVTGTVKEVDGKKEITASKIEVVKA